MFRGQHRHSIDVKGRVSIPAAYREELQGAADGPPFLTAEQSCLKLYPYADWCEYERGFLEETATDPDVQDYARLVISNAVESPIDKQGRILVPQYLREHAGLEKEVTIAGVGKAIEIWDTARFRMNLGRTQPNYDNLARTVAERQRERRGSRS